MSRRSDPSSSSSSSSSSTGTSGRSTRRGSEPDLLELIVVPLACLLLAPWAVAVLDRPDFVDFRFEGVDWLRALWLVPLFYGGVAAATYFLLPQLLEYFWLGHLLVAAVAVGWLVQVLFPGGPIELPVTPRVTTLSLVGVACTLVAALALAWLCGRAERLYAYWRTHEPGQYLLPVHGVIDRSDRMDARRALTLAKDRSALVLGETGAGKTETIKLLAHQLRARPDEPVVVFDYKGEYREFLERGGSRADDAAPPGERTAAEPGPDAGDVGDPSEADPTRADHDVATAARAEDAAEAVSPTDREIVRLSSTDATHYWNLFAEIERERDIEELAQAMFPRPEESEFFSVAARQLFVAVVTYLRRVAEREGTTPTNADLVTFVRTTDKRELHERLSTYDDLTAAAAAIDPASERQAAGVYANFQQVITELFRGDFAEAGAFSIREYMRDPDGRTLLLDFPIQEGAAVEPAFRLFVDWSARFALTDQRGAYFVLDEFARLPGLRKVGDLVNAGRSSNTQTLFGVQSVAQLRDTYGRDTADALLSGLVQTVALRVGDQPSVEYVRSQLGREHQRRTVPAHDRRGRSVGRQELQDEAYPVSERAVSRLADGEAFVITADGWVRGQLARLSEVRWALRQVLGTDR